jgi:hypothetical protein
MQGVRLDAVTLRRRFLSLRGTTFTIQPMYPLAKRIARKNRIAGALRFVKRAKGKSDRPGEPPHEGLQLREALFVAAFPARRLDETKELAGLEARPFLQIL